MIYIDNIGKKRIRIREVQNDAIVNSFVDFATWKATIGSSGMVTLKDMSRHHSNISGSIGDLIINGQPAPEDAGEVIEALMFVGSYGNIEIEDIQAIADIQINNAEAVIEDITNNQ